MTAEPARRRGVLAGVLATAAAVLAVTIALVVVVATTTPREDDVDPIPYAAEITAVEYRQQQAVPGFDSSWQETTSRHDIEQFASVLWTKGWKPGWRQDRATDACDGGRSAQFRVTFTDRTETIRVAQPCGADDELATGLLDLAAQWHDPLP